MNDKFAKFLETLPADAEVEEIEVESNTFSGLDSVTHSKMVNVCDLKAQMLADHSSFSEV